jgi:tRNA U34 2-thiouridine synthase MnmA/TrmU
MFPLGESQSLKRATQAQSGLAVAEKKESQEICFVPDGD